MSLTLICPTPRWLVVAALALAWCRNGDLICATAHADEPRVESPLAATVNGEPILVSEVERELAQALGQREMTADARRFLMAKTLAQLIDRRLIVQWLRTQRRGASAADVDLEFDRLEKLLKTRGVTLTEYLANNHTTELEYRRLLEWQLGWRMFLSRYLTDENLRKYFEDYRREFDGTRLRVAHILWKVPEANPSELAQVLEQAAQVRQAIVSGQLDFEQAARLHSSAPTSGDGGDLGFISRREPMPEPFSRAAFALQLDEVSSPVVTPFGVHLIRCTAIEVGHRTWEDAREELVAAVTRYLFNWAAERQRAQARIEFTDALPHFQPGTEQWSE